MRLVRVVGAVAAAGLVAAGCGSSGGGSSNGVANDSASGIVTAALNALKSASSVSISGTQTKSGQTTDLNGVFFSSGDIDTTVTQNGISFQLIKVGGTDYFKAPSSYWQSQGNIPAGDLPKLNNVWVSIPDSSAGVGSSLSLSAIASSLDKNLGTLTKGGTSTVNGQAVIAVTSSSQGTLYVATTGTPYPVQAVGKPGSANGGTLNFGSWNEGQAPTAPAGAETLAQLGLAGSGSGGTGGTGVTGNTGAPS
jgi:hypothetical protein